MDMQIGQEIRMCIISLQEMIVHKEDRIFRSVQSLSQY